MIEEKEEKQKMELNGLSVLGVEKRGRLPSEAEPLEAAISNRLVGQEVCHRELDATPKLRVQIAGICVAVRQEEGQPLQLGGS